MSKEASTEKASRKWWNKNKTWCCIEHEHLDIRYKAVYDQLVSLEARMELLDTLKEWKKLTDEDADHAKSVLKRGYDQLIKQHNLN